MYLLKGNYLPDVADPPADPVTVVEHVNDLGECRCRVLGEAALGFVPDWQGFTLRGYGKQAALPRMTWIDMSGAGTYWNWRIVENGQVVFETTRAARDANLSEEGLAELARLELDRVGPAAG